MSHGVYRVGFPTDTCPFLRTKRLHSTFALSGHPSIVYHLRPSVSPARNPPTLGTPCITHTLKVHSHSQIQSLCDTGLASCLINIDQHTVVHVYAPMHAANVASTTRSSRCQVIRNPYKGIALSNCEYNLWTCHHLTP